MRVRLRSYLSGTTSLFGRVSFATVLMGTALAVVSTTAVQATVVSAAAAPVQASDTLAAVKVKGSPANCPHAADTSFDDIVGLAATAFRASVPQAQLAGYDSRVHDFREVLGKARVHPGFLPVSAQRYGGKVEDLDDALVTYVVHFLDNVRSGQIDGSIPLSSLTVADAIEIFILSTRIVKIPAELLADISVGYVLEVIVGAVFSGVIKLTEWVEKELGTVCAEGPNRYHDTLPDVPTTVTEHVTLPSDVVALANAVKPADKQCPAIYDMKLGDVVERTRKYIHKLYGPDADPAQEIAGGFDLGSVDGTADAVEEFLRDNRIAKVALPRPPEELGPLVDYIDQNTLTYVVGLASNIYEGKTWQTVPLSDVTVGNAFGLAMAVLDTADLLEWAAVELSESTLNSALSGLGTAISAGGTLAYAPISYGAPIVRGVLQSMCAVP